MSPLAFQTESGETPQQPTIDGYELVQTLGEGGMGIVHLAKDKKLDRLVALKVLTPNFSGDPQAISRHKREATLLARINHPNIVQIHANGEANGQHFFTMTYVKGETLSESIEVARAGGASEFSHFLKRRSNEDYRPDLAACRIIYGIAMAMHEVHMNGLVHRDIKPGNIIINSRGKPVLVDFGVACDPNASGNLACDVTPGTLRFLPPEQFRGESIASSAYADVYALGATFYELLTLTPAFPQTEPGTLIDAICRGDYVPPRERDPLIPKSLEAIVQCAMATNPGDRFGSALAFAKALKEATCDLAESTDLHGSALISNLDELLAERTRGQSAWLFKGRSRSRRLFSALPDRRRRIRQRFSAAALALCGAAALWAGFIFAEGPDKSRLSNGNDHNVGLSGNAEEKPDTSSIVNQFVSSGGSPALLEAAFAYRSRNAERCREILVSTDAPQTPLAELAYWAMMSEVGRDNERNAALKMITAEVVTKDP